MKEVIKSISRLMIVVSALLLMACNNKTIKNNDKSCASIISSGDIVFDGLNGKITVPNSDTSFDFYEVITVSSGAKWSLSKDAYINDIIPTKIAPLSEGDNAYYIVVTSSDESNIQVYTVTVRRRPMYTVSFDTDGGTPVSSIRIEEGETITNKYETSKTGYTTVGWCIEGRLFDSTYRVMSDITLTAVFTPNEYTVTMDAKGYEYSGEKTYTVTFGETFTFPIVSGTSTIPSGNVYKTGESFRGWMKDDMLITDELGKLNGTWNIDSDVTLTPSVVDGLYFGNYPQTEVEATADNGLSSISFEETTWTDCGYYIGGSESSYMYYLDVDTDNDGSYDYRGVYFTSYRPSYTTSLSDAGHFMQDDNGYRANTVYWFRYEPIRWIILESTDGKALILAGLILDSQDYGYTNNYAESHIRKWLIDTFYETAFSELEKSIILTSAVDNSASSTASSSNQYVCTNTNDKVFLLSYQEASSYFSSNAERRTGATDYAKCQGLYVSRSGSSCDIGNWWLRSPSYFKGDLAFDVTLDGDFDDDAVTSTAFGVRVACWIEF